MLSGVMRGGAGAALEDFRMFFVVVIVLIVKAGSPRC